ncbi:hypothetical protein SOPP22_10350 [Shewanella sp. OPT22]|nr:hypothetical protein SOPP22_10350 [Shewanella sp. OPT22]
MLQSSKLTLAVLLGASAFASSFAFADVNASSADVDISSCAGHVMTVRIHNGLPDQILYFNGADSDGAHSQSGKLAMVPVNIAKNGMGADHDVNICFDQKMSQDNSAFTFNLSSSIGKDPDTGNPVLVNPETVTFSNAPYADPQTVGSNPTFVGSQEHRTVTASLMHNSKTCNDKSCQIEVDYTQ